MKEILVVVGTALVAMLVVVPIVRLSVEDGQKRWTAECKSNAALVTNATDRQYLNGRCYVVVEGKIKEIR